MHWTSVLAAENSWNDTTLRDVYWQILNEEILKELACRDESATLDTLINLLQEKFTRNKTVSRCLHIGHAHKLQVMARRLPYLVVPCQIPLSPYDLLLPIYVPKRESIVSTKDYAFIVVTANTEYSNAPNTSLGIKCTLKGAINMTHLSR